MSRVYQNVIMDSTRWAGFAPRDGDIIIATSYKAGTTWMQGICAALVFQQPKPPVSQGELSPWLDSNFGPIEEVLALLEGLRHRRYIKTHMPMDGLPYFEQARYIFVGRDGLEQVASIGPRDSLQRAPLDSDSCSTVVGGAVEQEDSGYRAGRTHDDGPDAVRLLTLDLEVLDEEPHRHVTALAASTNHVVPAHPGLVDREDVVDHELSFGVGEPR